MSEMREPEKQLRTGLIGVLLLAITALFLGMIQGFLETLFLAVVFSAMAMPLYERLLDRLGGRRAAASALTLIVVVAGVLIPGLLFVSLVAGQAADLAGKAAPWAQQFVERMGDSRLGLPDWFPLRDRIEALGPRIASKVASLAGEIGKFLLGSAAAVTKGTARFFLQLFVLVYAMFFFLMDGRAYVEKLVRTTTLRTDIQRRILAQAFLVARATIKGSLVIGVVQGVLGGLGFWACGIPNAALWGMVMGIASVIPGIGPAVVWVPAVVYLFATGETLPAVGLLAWSAVVVGTIDNVLRPKLVGGDTKMPDLVVLVSTLGGLATFGATGLILGPVIAAVFFAAWEAFAQIDQPPAEPTGSSDPGLRG